MNVCVYTLEEYEALLDKASNNNVGIAYDSGGWFYLVSEDCCEDVTDEKVCVWLGEEFQTIVTDVIVDISRGKVAIVYSCIES